MLSQAEVDQLIAQLTAGTLNRPVERREEPHNARVRLYDFRRPDKFSKDQLRTIQMIHDTFSRQLSGYFAGKTRTVVQTFITSVDQMTYAEFLRGVTNPGIIGVVKMTPLSGSALMEVTPNVGFPIIDRMLGGPGQALAKSRPLTEIELTVIEGILEGVVEILGSSWKNIIELRPSLEAIETNPMFVQVIAPNEVVVVVATEVRVGECAGAINLCLPYLCIEPVLPRLSAHQWFSSAQRGTLREPDSVTMGLREVPVEVTVELGDAEVTVEELLNLEPGDVVVLRQNIEHELKVYVDGRPKLLGRPGKSKKKVGVLVTREVGGVA
ncbi:MAG: flagellar motor switch protein FliM [Firmicutes bacterium]|jgi:flagellar motor switch protein FliM|nr:flagellar motor switch protein FliM [Bacillota bacterium]